MATYDKSNKNQGNVSREGTWLWNEFVIDTTTNNDEYTVFKLPSGCVILGGVVTVEVAGGGTTFEIDEVNVRDWRSGSAVPRNLAGAAISLKGTAYATHLLLGFAAAQFTGLQPAPHASSTDSTSEVFVNAVINTSSATGTPKVLIGLFVARVDYDKA